MQFVSANKFLCSSCLDINSRIDEHQRSQFNKVIIFRYFVIFVDFVMCVNVHYMCITCTYKTSIVLNYILLMIQRCVDTLTMMQTRCRPNGT